MEWGIIIFYFLIISCQTQGGQNVAVGGDSIQTTNKQTNKQSNILKVLIVFIFPVRLSVESNILDLNALLREDVQR